MEGSQVLLVPNTASAYSGLLKLELWPECLLKLCGMKSLPLNQEG